MDSRYLLDTNILSDLVRYPNGQAVQKIRTYGEDKICTSIVVACELRFGAAKKSSAILSAKIEALLAQVEVLPFNGDVDRHYARIRQYLELNGMPIGPNDMLIASHALASKLTLVSDNTREFSRIPDLKLENWL